MGHHNNWLERSGSMRSLLLMFLILRGQGGLHECLEPKPADVGFVHVQTTCSASREVWKLQLSVMIMNFSPGGIGRPQIVPPTVDINAVELQLLMSAGVVVVEVLAVTHFDITYQERHLHHDRSSGPNGEHAQVNGSRGRSPAPPHKQPIPWASLSEFETTICIQC